MAMLIAMCAWHPKYWGWPKLLGIRRWGWRSLMVTHGLCPACARRLVGR